MTTRFFAAGKLRARIDALPQLADALRSMPATDYLETRDRDAAHLLNALDAAQLVVTPGNPAALPPARLLRRLARLQKGLAQQPAEFTRTPDEDGSGDMGLSEDALWELSSLLARLCRQAHEQEEPLVVLFGYSRRELGLPRLW